MRAKSLQKVVEMAQKEQELIEKLEKLEAMNKKLSSENIVLQNKLFAMYKKNGVTLTKHTLEEILDAVSEYTSQSKKSIRSKTRKPSYVWARAIFIVIAKKNYRSDKYIASFLNKDRTSIINAEALVGKNSDIPNEFHKTLRVDNIMSLNSLPITSIDPDYIVENYSYTLIDNYTGNEKLAYVANGHLHFIDEADLGRQSVRPMNKEQKLFVNAILSDLYQIIISDAKAGSGKTLLSLATAMRLVSKKKFSNIVYVRNSIESLAKGEDVGFLPGLEEKFRIYNHPLYDSLRFIAKSELTKSNANKSKANTTVISEDTITAKVDEYIEKYRIQTMWVGEMRGRTISDAIVIVDEIQNCSASTGQLILSRLDKNCKVICIGSNRQIDNLYTNKYINSLSFLLKAAKSLHSEVSLFAIELNRVLRGPITEWSEKIFTRK